MTRTGQDAIDWGRRQITQPSQDWYRLCKMFVRLCFAVPSDGTPDAGKAWDNAKHRHFERDPMKIPEAVPVFWELPSVADHVTISTGNGQCLTNDFRRRGKIDVAGIDEITRGWGATLLGWTEDIDGVRIWTPPAQPEPEPDDPNRIQKARADVWDAIARLDRAVKAGRGEDVEEFRRDLRRALRTNVKK